MLIVRVYDTELPRQTNTTILPPLQAKMSILLAEYTIKRKKKATL